MTLFNRNILIIFLLLNLSSVCAQTTIGYPFLKNYKHSEYNSGRQSWMISQAPNELMYFANNEGLLEFDGLNWNLHSLPDWTIMRSVFADTDGRIYVGSYNNFGYFEENKLGKLVFHSLLNLLNKSNTEYSEIWRIHKTKEGIVFQSYKNIIIYNNNTIKIYSTPHKFHFSFYVNNKLYLNDTKNGIYEFKNKEFIFLEGTESLVNKEICGIIPLNDNLLIATTNNGIYKYENNKLIEWKNASSEFLIKNQIYSLLRIDNERIAFGTIQNGVLVTDNEGIPIYHLNEDSGLQNNTILNMYLDADKNLWLATDNGIDLIYIHSSLRQLNKQQGLSSGYSAAIHNNKLYLASNRGVFFTQWNKNGNSLANLSSFKLIEETKGQVWTLQVIDNVLFCGHNDGTFIIDGTNVQQISSIKGAWTFLHSKQNPNIIIGGNYSGLSVYEKQKEKWIFKEHLKGFEESSRVMVFDGDENIWMSHGFKGLYHIYLNSKKDSILNVKFYNSKNGFQSDYGINVSKIQNEVVFFSPKGAYVYSKNKDAILPSDFYTKLFPEQVISYAYEDSLRNIWYFTDKQMGVKRILEDGSYLDITSPFKALDGSFIGGFQFVFPIDNSNLIVGNENGFIYYNSKYEKIYKKNFNVFIHEVRISGSDSVLFQGHLFERFSNIPTLSYSENKLYFSYSAVNYENTERLKFSTYLEGYDEQWTNWDTKRNREFTNLKEGRYVFKVKARDIYNVETEITHFEFVIKPPLMRTTAAFVLYGFGVVVLIFYLYFLIRKRENNLKIAEKLKQKNKYIEKEKELKHEALLAEKEIIRLRNEKLQMEVKNKDKELANSTMLTIQKNKFLNSIKKDLSKIAGDSVVPSVKASARNIIKKIDNNINNSENWKVFETHFSNVHEEFMSRIKKEYPEISPAELRLCACLRMNISSKEIAELLNISLRGVEASRYRLRRSLNLDRSINLTDFILSF